MKKKFFLPGMIIVFLVFASSAFATNGMRMIGFGPVQRSVGGISVGLPLDAASIISNPAGMVLLGGRIDFGASFFKPTVEYKATDTGVGFIQNNNSIESDKGASPVPAFGLIVPINKDLFFGIAAYGIAGMGVDYEKNFYNSITYTNYTQMRFSPGLAYKVNDMISVGFVANIMYATLGFNAANHGGPGSQEPHMSSSALGYGATLSAIIKPVDILSVGIAYETKSVFQKFKFNTNDGKDEMEFNQPQSATIGLGVEPAKGLKIGFDVQWIRWSETNGEDLPEWDSKSTASVMSFNCDWEDQIVYKIGLEYTVIPVLAVRAGFNYGKMPLNEDRAFENIAFPAIAEYHYTAGIGLNLSDKFALNIGGMYSPEAKISGSNPTGQFVQSYETKMSQYSLDFGISYKF